MQKVVIADFNSTANIDFCLPSKVFDSTVHLSLLYTHNLQIFIIIADIFISVIMRACKCKKN